MCMHHHRPEASLATFLLWLHCVFAIVLEYRPQALTQAWTEAWGSNRISRALGAHLDHPEPGPPHGEARGLSP